MRLVRPIGLRSGKAGEKNGSMRPFDKLRALLTILSVVEGSQTVRSGRDAPVAARHAAERIPPQGTGRDAPVAASCFAPSAFAAGLRRDSSKPRHASGRGEEERPAAER